MIARLAVASTIVLTACSTSPTPGPLDAAAGDSAQDAPPDMGAPCLDAGTVCAKGPDCSCASCCGACMSTSSGGEGGTTTTIHCQ